MPQRLLLEGSDIDAVLARVRAEHGPDAEIITAQERLVGGVGGFFARRRFEVSVQVPDAAAPGTGSAGSRPSASSTAPDPTPALTPASTEGAHRLPTAQEQTMTANGSAASPLASTVYDALRDAAGGGSLEDLLSVADRQDGAMPFTAATPSPAAPAAPAAPAGEDAGFRPAPYLPAALQSPVPSPVQPAQPPLESAAQPRGAHRAEPADAPGFEELLRDLMEQREIALRAGAGPQPFEDATPAPRGRHAARPADAPSAPQPAPAPRPAAHSAPAPQSAPRPAPHSARTPQLAAAEYRPWETQDVAPAPVAVPAPVPAVAPAVVRAAEPTVAPDPVAEPETRRRAGHRRSASTSLAPAGLVALGLSPDSPVRATSDDERTVLLDLLTDVAAAAPTELRGTAVLVGPSGPARAVARQLLAELGLPRQALLVADCEDEDLVVTDVLVGAAERCGRHGAAVVVLATGSTRQEGRAAGRLAALLGSGPLTAVVDATREAHATRSWLAAVAEAGRSVDDLAAFAVTETSVPLRLLELGHPVSWLDAAPATLGTWAAPCLERLQA